MGSKAKHNLASKTNGTYSVYKHTNIINGKVYIGITVNEPILRWGKDGHGYDKQKFGIAIKEYGWDNFSHEILFRHLTQEEAYKKEIELISFYDSTNPSRGYNVHKGGNVLGLGCITAKPVFQYTFDGKFIKQYNSAQDASDDTKVQRVNIRRNCNKGINYSAGGYRWSYEYLGECIAWELLQNNFYQEVYCYNMDGEFIKKYMTVAEAQKDTGIDNSAICGCYKGKTSNTQGLRWFKEYLGDKINPLHYTITKRGQIREKRVPKTRLVYQYSLDGNMIMKHLSARAASELIGVKPVDINNACLDFQKRGHSYHGYYWSYIFYSKSNDILQCVKEQRRFK